jgi:hypothetical protein
VTTLDAAADRLLEETGSTGADNQYGIRSETYLRMAANRDAALAGLSADVPAEWPDVFHDLRDETVITADQLRAVSRKTHLNSFQVDVVDLYLRSLSIPEIARVTDCSQGRVRRALDEFTVRARAWFAARDLGPSQGAFATGSIYTAPRHCRPGYERCARTGICPYRTAE